MKRSITATIVGITILVSACASGAGTASPGEASPTPTGIAHPTGADELIVRIQLDGGFVAPGYLLTRLPIVSIFGDGRVIVEGPQIMIFPGPALPNLQAFRVSEAGLQRILETARTAGLFGPDRHIDFPGIADAATTTFIVVADGARHEISAYALAEAIDSSGIPAADKAARDALLAFEQQLGDLRSWLGADVLSADEAYTFTSLRILATPAEPGPEGDVPPTFVDWPLAPLAGIGQPLVGRGEGARCAVVSGDDLATLRPILEKANQLTFWASEGRTYQIGLRPLLPDESGCPTG